MRQRYAGPTVDVDELALCVLPNGTWRCAVSKSAEKLEKSVHMGGNFSTPGGRLDGDFLISIGGLLSGVC